MDYKSARMIAQLQSSKDWCQAVDNDFQELAWHYYAHHDTTMLTMTLPCSPKYTPTPIGFTGL